MVPRIEVMTVVAVVTPSGLQDHPLPDYFDFDALHPDVQVVAFDSAELEPSIDWRPTGENR